MSSSNVRRFWSRLFSALFLLSLTGYAASFVAAHPLGNFTINHFSRLQLGREKIVVRYVIDMAEISTFQELQSIGASGEKDVSAAQLDAYVARVAPQYAQALALTIDGERIPLMVVNRKISLPEGAGGLPTMRIEIDLSGTLPPAILSNNGAHQLRYQDGNHRERLGWREIVIEPVAGINVYDSSAYGSAITDELRAYPQDMLTSPLNETHAALSFSEGALPSGAVRLRARDGRAVEGKSRDRLAELIAVPQLTPAIALLGLAIAALLGAFHAFSPGHGKTVVGAYLVGARGTARHAVFLGLTVTITHTIGVYALGLITLYASQYVVPETLFPVLSFVSGAIVLGIGLSLFFRRLFAAINGRAASAEETKAYAPEQHGHDLSEISEHRSGGAFVHSHGGGRAHSHQPPGADGGRVTWRSLLALGVSGGLLPCPSALVVLLSAITMRRVGYGLALVFAFSIGLAVTLTAIGLAFVYAGRFVKRPTGGGKDGVLIVRLLPVLSALVIACVGAVICYQAIAPNGVSFSALADGLARLAASFGVARS